MHVDCTKLDCYLPVRFIADGLIFLYHFGMDEMLETLEKIGIAHDQCERIRDRFDGDLDGLAEYVLICIAMFDDRHEYVD